MKRMILLGLLLSGCATTPKIEYTWNHPTQTQADFRKDAAYCNYELQIAAGRAPKPYNIAGLILFEEWKESYFDSCLEIKGYIKIAMPAK